jgi:hypothetical protein
MVREAYKLLKNYIGQDIREMKDHVGISQTGTAAFNPGNYLVVGAWREDEEDVLYGYDGIGTTCTHFWDPDGGDGSHFISPTGASYHNAYEKAMNYLNNGPIFWPYTSAQPFGSCGVPLQYIGGIKFQYRSLIDFYKTGYIEIIGIVQLGGNLAYLSTPCPQYVTSKSDRDKVVYEILGRVCHLLGDMTVPAHALNDPHPPLDEDMYENWMSQSSIHTQWTYLNAIAQGGLINSTQYSSPIKYLFYPTAQISGFFSTGDVGGNTGSGINDPFALYPGLSEMIQHLNSEFNGAPPAGILWLNGTSDHAFVYGIRSIAGLLYWFAKEVGLLPIPITGVSLIGTEILYQGATGVWGTLQQNGIEPFTYNWQIKYVDGGGYLQSFTSVKAEKEKKDKEKKKDGEIIIALAPSNEWVPLGLNSDVLTRPIILQTCAIII